MNESWMKIMADSFGKSCHRNRFWRPLQPRPWQIPNCDVHNHEIRCDMLFAQIEKKWCKIRWVSSKISVPIDCLPTECLFIKQHHSTCSRASCVWRTEPNSWRWINCSPHTKLRWLWSSKGEQRDPKRWTKQSQAPKGSKRPMNPWFCAALLLFMCEQRWNLCVMQSFVTLWNSKFWDRVSSRITDELRRRVLQAAWLWDGIPRMVGVRNWDSMNHFPWQHSCPEGNLWHFN